MMTKRGDIHDGTPEDAKPADDTAGAESGPGRVKPASAVADKDHPLDRVAAVVARDPAPDA